MKKKTNHILTVIIILFNTGWIIPIYIGIDLQYTWYKADVIPTIYKLKPTGTVFPLDLSEKLIKISLIWLFILFLFWSVFFIKRYLLKNWNITGTGHSLWHFEGKNEKK